MVNSTKISKKKKICFFYCQTTIIVIFLSFVVVCVRGEILLISNILQHRKPKNNNINDNFSSSSSYIKGNNKSLLNESSSHCVNGITTHKYFLCGKVILLFFILKLAFQCFYFQTQFSKSLLCIFQNSKSFLSLSVCDYHSLRFNSQKSVLAGNIMECNYNKGLLKSGLKSLVW